MQLKKETLAQVFSCEIYDIFKNIFFREHLQTTASELTFLKQPVIAEDEIKVSVILANKYKIKAKNFIFPILSYGNCLVVRPPLVLSLFLFRSSSKTFSRYLKKK